MFTVGQGWPVAGPEKPHMRSHLLPRVAAVLAIGLLAGCGGGGSTGTSDLSGEIPEGMSKVNFGITDAPFPAGHDCLSAAIVEIDEVSLKGKRGWVDLAVDGGTATIDLLQLRSGLADLLATGTVPAGKYNDLRLHVVRAVLVFSDGSPDREFRIAKGHSHRIDVKIKPAVTLTSGKTVDLMLDIDLNGSFKVKGAGRCPDCADLKSGEGRVVFYPRIRAHQAPAAPPVPPAGGGDGGSGGGDGGTPPPCDSTVASVAGTVLDASGSASGAALVFVYPAGFVFDGFATEPTAATFSASAGGVAAEGSYQLVLEPGSWDFYVQATGANEPTLAVTLTVAACDNFTQDLALP
jgi:hypothetical protein